MDQGFDHGGVVHVGPHQHRHRSQISATVGSLEVLRAGHRVDGEPVGLDEFLDGRTETAGCLAYEQVRARSGGQRLARSLTGVEDGGHREPPQDRPLGLGLPGIGPIPSSERPHVPLGITSFAAHPTHGGQDGVTVLAPLDRATECPPGLEPSDEGGRRIGHTTFRIGPAMLGEDQHDVVGAVVVQVGLEIEELAPIVPTDQ